MEAKVYRLCNGKAPLSLLLASKNTHRKTIVWYDEEKNESRPLRFALNQKSIFEDEQNGHIVMGEIEFVDGTLVCDPRRDVNKIKFLDLHPDNKANGGGIFEVMDHEAEAKKIIDLIEIEAEAVSLARTIDEDDLEGIGVKIWGNKALNTRTSELRRDVLIYARNNPEAFLEMFEDVDSDVQVTIARALENKYIQWRKDDTELYWNLKDNKKMIHRVERGGNPEKSLHKFITTSREGGEFYNALMKIME